MGSAEIMKAEIAQPFTKSELKLSATLLIFLIYLTLGPAPAESQIRGVYPLGMSATNSGITPAAGFSYVNQLLFYSRGQSKGPGGELLATGQQAVLMDMNTLVWVSAKKYLGDAKFSMSATIPFANNSLESTIAGHISGGEGLADSYYQPFILGWEKEHAAFRAVYGFLAPTGKFVAGANDNVGSGYWTHAFSSGQTFFLTANKATVLSAFQMVEVHTAQESTGIHPGDTLSLDYSATHTMNIATNMRFQFGAVGYSQWQTTAKTGSAATSISPVESAARYRVHSLGFTSNIIFPSKNASLGFKYFSEFGGRSTYEGYSAQISGSIKF